MHVNEKDGLDDAPRSAHQEFGLRNPQATDDVRPAEVGCALQRATLDRAQDALLLLLVSCAATNTTWIAIPWPIRDPVGARSVARLMHRHIALVAKDYLIVVLPLAVLADGAEGHLLITHGRLPPLLARERKRVRIGRRVGGRRVARRRCRRSRRVARIATPHEGSGKASWRSRHAASKKARSIAICRERRGDTRRIPTQ